MLAHARHSHFLRAFLFHSPIQGGVAIRLACGLPPVHSQVFGNHPMRLPRVLAAALLAGLSQPSCTLTDDGFEPAPLVARVPAPDTDDDAPPAEGPPPASIPEAPEPEPDAECCAPSELPGCVTPLDSGPSACEGD